MPSLLRQEVVASAKTVVIKIGTNVLSRDDDRLDTDRVAKLAEQILRIMDGGRRVVVVSSGAVAAGIGLLGLSKRPDDLPHLQAAAATGQAHLIGVYDAALKKHGRHAAQILLTLNDFKSRARYLNVRNTLNTLFEYGVVPIVNENDTVSVAEIRFGDNDQLAAMVTSLVEPSLLVILSVVDGLFDGDPSDSKSKVIHTVTHWEDALLDNVANTRSRRGMGGMRSKLEAVHKATAVGECVVIANGTDATILDQIIAGEEVGTLFLAQGASVPAWKRWIGFTVTPKGKIWIDDGARRAIADQGRSLLAIGITRVEGEFSKGEVVSIANAQGDEIARGLPNFNSGDVVKVAGKRSEEIRQILGGLPYGEIIHRDNLVVTRRGVQSGPQVE
jgi:glutamate 5-kinase